MNISTPTSRYPETAGVRFFSELSRQVRALPGVQDASVITFLPFKGVGSGTYYWRAEKGQPAPGQEPVTDVRMVQPRYFETMRIPLRKGRTFEAGDLEPKAPLRFVINESLARTMFPGEDPIGRRLVVLMSNENPPAEIIGVVGDVKHGSLTDKTRPMVYYPQSHLYFGFGSLVVAANVEPLSLTRAVTDVVHRMDPELAVSEVGTMQRWVDDSLIRTRFQTGLLSVFAALALALAVLGIYAVMSYAVGQRTKEIGIRMALGAGRGRVAAMILSRGMLLAMIGAAIGLAGAGMLSRYLKSLLFEIEPGDPLTMAAVTLLILGVAVAAALAPAGRATKVDPMVVLRYE
jgi:putative ABC transport system permease protein